jgi:hypothetical protein
MHRKQVLVSLAAGVLVCCVVACDDPNTERADPTAIPADARWFDSVEFAGAASADGGVCFELSATDWTVPNTCWQPPFLDTWQQAAFGSVRSAEGDNSLASLLIAGDDTHVQAVTQLGEAVPWMQNGRGLVVTAPFNVTGGAPVEISFAQDGKTKVCSVGPPEVACLTP